MSNIAIASVHDMGRTRNGNIADSCPSGPRSCYRKPELGLPADRRVETLAIRAAERA